MAPTTDTTTSTFEFFQGTHSESSSSPRITVRRGGLMVITRAAVDMLGDEVSRVQLAYNRTTGDVGIRAASDDTPGSYLLRTQPKSPSRLVSGKRFFQHHRLPVDEARTFTAQDYGNGIVGFRLQGTAETAEPVEPAEAAPAPKKAAPGRSRPRHEARCTVDYPSRAREPGGVSRLAVCPTSEIRRDPATNPAPTG